MNLIKPSEKAQNATVNVFMDNILEVTLGVSIVLESDGELLVEVFADLYERPWEPENTLSGEFVDEMREAVISHIENKSEYIEGHTPTYNFTYKEILNKKARMEWTLNEIGIYR
jgi:hypothetical protein